MSHSKEIIESSGLEVELLDAEDAKSALKPGELEEMIKELVKNTYEKEEMGKMKEVAVNFNRSINDVLDDVDLKRGFHPDDSQLFTKYEERIQGTIDKAKELLKNGDIILAMVNGKPAAMIGLEKMMVQHNGKDVVMVTKGVTMPEFEGKQIFTLLWKKIIEKARIKYPGKLLLGFTKNPKLIDSFKKKEIPEGTYEDFLRIGRYQVTQENIDELAKEGWKVFIWDPEEFVGK